MRTVATPDYVDVPSRVLAELRSICAGLPEAYEEPAWAGIRWRIRKHTFAHVRSAVGRGTWLKFRLRGEELEAVVAAGHPFTRGYGPSDVAVVLDDSTDWGEIAELLAESYRLFAPKKLVAELDSASGG